MERVDFELPGDGAGVDAPLVYWTLPPAGDGLEGAKDRAVLLVHGLGCNGRALHHGGFDQAEALALTRFGWVVAPDLLGHGASPAPRGEERYTMAAQARVVLALLAHLGVLEVCVVGHSMGGPIALAVAETCAAAGGPARLRCVAYSEPNIDGNDCFGSRRGTCEGVDLATLDEAAAAHAASCRDLVRVSDSGDVLARMDALCTARGVPSLVVIGERNRGKTTSEGALLAAGFPVEWIGGAGHCQHVDNPRAFYDVLCAFVDRALRAEPASE